MFSKCYGWFSYYVEWNYRIIRRKETKTILRNCNEKKQTFNTQNVYILLAFLLITIALLTAVSIYCYLIKYRAKQKHLLPFHVKNNDLKEINIKGATKL